FCKKEPLWAALPGCLRPSLPFHLFVAMRFNQQFPSGFQPLRTAPEQHFGIFGAKDIKFAKGHHNEVERMTWAEVTNILFLIVNSQTGGLCLLLRPTYRCR